MGARYQVPVNAAALHAQPWLGVAGLRLVSRDGPWDAQPEWTLCTFEDEHAPASLEGRVVDLALRVHDQAGPVPVVKVTRRTVIA